MDIGRLLKPDIIYDNNCLFQFLYGKLVILSGYLSFEEQHAAESNIFQLQYPLTNRIPSNTRFGSSMCRIVDSKTIPVYIIPGSNILRPANTDVENGFYYINMVYLTD